MHSSDSESFSGAGGEHSAGGVPPSTPSGNGDSEQENGSPSRDGLISLDQASKVIGESLVSDGVANNPDDVNGVLTNGFFHLYGPINDYAG